MCMWGGSDPTEQDTSRALVPAASAACYRGEFGWCLGSHAARCLFWSLLTMWPRSAWCCLAWASWWELQTGLQLVDACAARGHCLWGQAWDSGGHHDGAENRRPHGWARGHLVEAVPSQRWLQLRPGSGFGWQLQSRWPVAAASRLWVARPEVQACRGSGVCSVNWHGPFGGAAGSGSRAASPGR